MHARLGATVRSAAHAVLLVLGCTLVWFALVLPAAPGLSSPSALLRIPVEALVVLAMVLVLPRRAARVAAAIAGALAGLIGIVELLDVAFVTALGRPFDPVVDWSYRGSVLDLLSYSLGRPAAIAAMAGACLLAVAAVALMAWSLAALACVADRHRAASFRVLTAIGAAAVLVATIGLRAGPDEPIVDAGATTLAVDRIGAVRASIRDQAAFAAATGTDPLASTPPAQLLTALRGKDVLVVFVESYGRVAVTDPAIAPSVDAALDTGTNALQAAGFSARTGYLTSPTFGGISWLAHSTLQSGLWVDSQQRYDTLVAGNRFTLSDAFAEAGWRTVADIPANTRAWPEGTAFYHYDTVYDARNVGYRGPGFGIATMPDQYTLAAFRRLELANPEHDPVMAEIDLITSHGPWAPLPRMVGWDEVGDGSVFAPMPGEPPTPGEVVGSQAATKAAYARSIAYSLTALTSFVATYPDPNLVLVVLGDHQPAAVVSGPDASRDVPVSIIAHDPAVLQRIAGWGWTPGLTPTAVSPVWPMDAFRDRFLTAYGWGGG